MQRRNATSTSRSLKNIFRLGVSIATFFFSLGALYLHSSVEPGSLGPAEVLHDAAAKPGSSLPSPPAPPARSGFYRQGEFVPTRRKRRGKEDVAEEDRREGGTPLPPSRDTLVSKVSTEPITVEETTRFLTGYLRDLHSFQEERREADSVTEIWNGFYELAERELYPWDRQYLKRLPKR